MIEIKTPQNLKYVRGIAGFTAERLAEALGMTLGQYTAMEREVSKDHSIMLARKLKEIARILDIDPNAIKFIHPRRLITVAKKLRKEEFLGEKNISPIPIQELIWDAYKACADENGFANLARVGSALKLRHNAFLPEHYGYKQLRPLVKSLDRYDITGEKMNNMVVFTIKAKEIK